jgi:glycosyltransferase involved in cell wall biosynthesis
MQLYRLEHERRDLPELLTCHFLPGYVTYYVNMGDVIEGALKEITWQYTIRMVNGFDHVVFPTKTQERAFVEEGLKQPSTVISNGLNIRRYSPDAQGEEDVEARYELPSGPRILAVGRLAKDKKLAVLIRAMRQVTQAYPAHLLLVGRGDDRERLEELAQDLDLGDHVHFLGFVPEEDLPAIYRHSDIFTIASDVEVQSIPTLQAAATGLPIVAADAAALPELVENNKNGFLVAPDDPAAFAAAFREILDHPERAEGFRQASLDIGRQHADEDTFDAYEALYREYAL